MAVMLGKQEHKQKDFWIFFLKRIIITANLED